MNRRSSRSIGRLRVWMALWAAGLPCGPALPAPPPGAALFAEPTLVTLQLELSAAAMESLRREPRVDVLAVLKSGESEYAEVRVHLKGGQGSFRPLDDKPAFTLKFGRGKSGRRFQGLRKIHLNNSVQDSSYVCEDLAGELFRRAGLPAPRTAWARVSLNGRALGLYVLKEGFDKDFLGRHFEDAGGNFYDGGLHSDVVHPLELDSGGGAGDRADLAALAGAAGTLPLSERWSALEKTLDTERFISFMAMEVLSGHSDGYCLMQNNYRVYFAPPRGRAVFLPHGMDRMFWEAEAPLEPRMKSIVAIGVMETMEGRARYRRRVMELAEQAFGDDWMIQRAEVVARLLEPVNDVAARDARLAGARAAARARFARAQVAAWRGE